MARGVLEFEVEPVAYARVDVAFEIECKLVHVAPPKVGSRPRLEFRLNVGQLEARIAVIRCERYDEKAEGER